MRDLLVLVIIAMSIGLMLTQPFIGTLVWAWVSYLNPQKMTFGFAGEFPFLAFVAAGTIVSWLISREPKRIPSHPVTVVMLMYLFWTIVTTVFSVDPYTSAEKLNMFWKIIAFAIVTIALVNTKQRLMYLLYTICLSLGYFGLKGGVFTVLGGGSARVYGPVGTMLGDNNNLAMALAMTVPLLYFLSRHAETKHFRMAAGVIALFTVISVLGTGSRGGLVSLTAAGLWLIARSRARWGGLIGAVLVAALAFLFMPQEWLERMASIGSATEDDSFLSRVEMWRFAVNVANHDPLTGGGFWMFRKAEFGVLFVPAAIRLRASHSIYFEVLGEHGYVGLFLFIWLLSIAFVAAGYTRKLAASIPELAWARDLSSMVQASLIAYAVGGALLELAIFDLFYHLAAISVITQMLVLRHMQAHGIEIPKIMMSIMERRKKTQFVRPASQPVGAPPGN